jgi:MinD superfamily P-loop ATPase
VINTRTGRPPEAGLALNVIEATRFSRQEFDRIAAVARELRMTRSEVIRRSVGFGIGKLTKAMRQSMEIDARGQDRKEE